MHGKIFGYFPDKLELVLSFKRDVGWNAELHLWMSLAKTHKNYYFVKMEPPLGKPSPIPTDKLEHWFQDIALKVSFLVSHHLLKMRVSVK